MSHVATQGFDIAESELDALAAVLGARGMELRRNQTHYAWWGVSVGDSPLPEGMRVEDLGHCSHAIRIIGTTPRNGAGGPWEIGLWRKANGRFDVVCDYFGSAGQQLYRHAGRNCSGIKQDLQTEISRRHLLKLGYRVSVQDVAQQQAAR